MALSGKLMEYALKLDEYVTENPQRLRWLGRAEGYLDCLEDQGILTHELREKLAAEIASHHYEWQAADVPAHEITPRTAPKPFSKPKTVAEAFNPAEFATQDEANRVAGMLRLSTWTVVPVGDPEHGKGFYMVKMDALKTASGESRPPRVIVQHGSKKHPSYRVAEVPPSLWK